MPLVALLKPSKRRLAMKKSMIVILAAATTFAGIQSVRASDKEKYLLGGLLGGWILNEVFEPSIHVRHHRPAEIHTRRAPCPPVIVDRHHDRRPSGRYEYRQVKIWIQGRHERIVSRCGRVETRWVPGRYEYRTDKVWVPYGRYDSRSYGHRSH
jgi:hypothetical protein